MARLLVDTHEWKTIGEHPYIIVIPGTQTDHSHPVGKGGYRIKMMFLLIIIVVKNTFLLNRYPDVPNLILHKIADHAIYRRIIFSDCVEQVKCIGFWIVNINSSIS